MSLIHSFGSQPKAIRTAEPSNEWALRCKSDGRIFRVTKFLQTAPEVAEKLRTKVRAEPERVAVARFDCVHGHERTGRQFSRLKQNGRGDFFSLDEVRDDGCERRVESRKIVPRMGIEVLGRNQRARKKAWLNRMRVQCPRPESKFRVGSLCKNPKGLDPRFPEWRRGSRSPDFRAAPGVGMAASSFSRAFRSSARVGSSVNAPSWVAGVPVPGVGFLP